MIILTVMYPRTSESRFDFDYYLQKHVPLVRARLTALGMKKLDLMRGSAALDGGTPGFEVIAQLSFLSMQHLQDSLAQHGAEIIGDIATFTNIQPVMQINEPM